MKTSPKGRQYFFVDLQLPDKSLQVVPYDMTRLKQNLRDYGASTIWDLNDYDWRLFDSEKKAEKFLSTYKKIKSGLSNRKICKSRQLPAILYKRRYMVLTLMGLKNQTYRHYEKNWKPRQLFNLHDQVFFLTVRLTSLTFNKNTKRYCYRFKLPR